jgi:kinesin family protein C1
MQQRIARLEREKMQLSLAKAPLEERLKQKEEHWAKEQNNLKQQIDGLRAAAKESDDRCRSLEHANSELVEEKKKLVLDLHKCSVNGSRQHNTETGGTSSTFQRQLQNDRDVQDLRQKLHAADEEVRSLKLDKLSLESEVSASAMELDTLVNEFEKLEDEYKQLEASSSQSNDAEIKLAVLEREHIATSAQLNAVCSDLAAIKSSSESAMEEVKKQWKSEVVQLKFALAVLKTRKGAKDDDEDSTDINSSVEDEAVLRARIEERDAKITELEAQLLKGAQLRRQMHNRIQELRGNIRVFVRTRPFLPGDGTATESAVSVLRDGETLRLSDKAKKSHEFKFDKVFAPSSGQDGVFDEVSEFVQSALDGYHVVLFCYGMTGSGKTHTMQGSGNGAMRGIIPRAVEQVLSQAKLMQSQKWQFTMTASFLEIYNEELKDLLTSMNKGATAEKVATRQSSRHGHKLAIKRDANGKSFVDGLSKVAIETNDTEKGMGQLEALMAVAARSRSVASTAMNSQSSRSHSVFMLHLRGYNVESDTVVEGALNLCDLAGSERLDRSGAAADRTRLKETLSINKSLSSLGDVFTSLANKSKHVPYRNSKLTYLLQDCLSGDGKALMFVNLSPTEQSSNESLCSLRFAQRVNQIELGKPTKHVQYGDK